MFNRIESILKSKRSAEYVRSMVSNNAKPQDRLYVRNLTADKEREAQIYKKRANAKSMHNRQNANDVIQIKTLRKSNLCVSDVDDGSSVAANSQLELDDNSDH